VVVQTNHQITKWSGK